MSEINLKFLDQIKISDSLMQRTLEKIQQKEKPTRYFPYKQALAGAMALICLLGVFAWQRLWNGNKSAVTESATAATQSDGYSAAYDYAPTSSEEASSVASLPQYVPQYAADGKEILAFPDYVGTFSWGPTCSFLDMLETENLYDNGPLYEIQGEITSLPVYKNPKYDEAGLRKLAQRYLDYFNDKPVGTERVEKGSEIINVPAIYYMPGDDVVAFLTCTGKNTHMTIKESGTAQISFTDVAIPSNLSTDEEKMAFCYEQFADLFKFQKPTYEVRHQTVAPGEENVYYYAYEGAGDTLEERALNYSAKRVEFSIYDNSFGSFTMTFTPDLSTTVNYPIISSEEAVEKCYKAAQQAYPDQDVNKRFQVERVELIYDVDDSMDHTQPAYKIWLHDTQPEMQRKNGYKTVLPVIVEAIPSEYIEYRFFSNNIMGR